MILRRLGNKQGIADKILQYFPKHSIYIEPFFGAGGIFFNKPKADFNIMNDIDSDVFNLFTVISTNKEEFEQLFRITPIHQELLNYWKTTTETDPIKKAVRFVCLSNNGFMGMPNIRFGADNNGLEVYKYLDATSKKIFGVKFDNSDFRKFLTKLCWRNEDEKQRAFIYADPPYLGTTDNYSHSFVETDSNDLFDSLQNTGCRFAVSEFDNEFILLQAKNRGLNIITIGERNNLKNRRTEILITNYENAPTLFS